MVEDVNLTLMEQYQHYAMIAGRLYKKGKDMCIEKEETPPYVQRGHITIGNVHFSPPQLR